MADTPDHVERRRRYIDRQTALNRGDVNVTVRGRSPEGTGSANRHGMPRLPVGQHEVRNWPVLDLGELPETDMSAWALEVGGLAIQDARRTRSAEGRSDIPYTTNLPLERAVEDDVLLVHTREGRPLPAEHGGPVRMITPKLYAWKDTKEIRRIEFLPQNQRGFWELRGYSDSAEPWFNDRYST